MKARTFKHKSKIKIWITGIIAMTSLIGFAWWIDDQELTFLEGWAKWMDDVHFLVSFVTIMLYFGVIMVIVHFYWKLIKWIVDKLINKFY